MINDGASAYQGVIPEDCWHEPYMSEAELDQELAAGVEFALYESDGAVLGVMGLQDVEDVALIRHAYVRSERQGEGIGSALLEHCQKRTQRPLLIGTWAAAVWAVGFYEGHDFQVVSHDTKEHLLRKYWTVPERQIETSVVLVDRRWRKDNQ